MFPAVIMINHVPITESAVIRAKSKGRCDGGNKVLILMFTALNMHGGT